MELHSFEQQSLAVNFVYEKFHSVSGSLFARIIVVTCLMFKKCRTYYVCTYLSLLHVDIMEEPKVQW